MSDARNDCLLTIFSRVRPRDEVPFIPNDLTNVDLDAPRDGRDGDIVAHSLKWVLRDVSDALHEHEDPGDGHAEWDGQPHEVARDAFQEGRRVARREQRASDHVELMRQAQREQDDEHPDEHHVQCGELARVREVLDPLGFALEREQLPDQLLELDVSEVIEEAVEFEALEVGRLKVQAC